MKKILILVIISLIVTTFFYCAGYQVSYGVGFGANYGPYGYGSYAYPRVNVGVYGGGYPGYRY